MPPRGVTLKKSPCRQIPGHSPKYVALYLVMFSSSPQNFTGIDGSGRVITISPTSSTTASPWALNAYAATPRFRCWCSPA